jgi:predicted HicB family RNase H-like nuclease
VNTKDYSLFGTILFIDEEISYSGRSFAELEEDFHKAVDAHRQLCRDKGEEPPFS